MHSDLYERDVLVWSEQQSELLQRLARGERVNADIDWPNLIEEVRALGLSELHACESLLLQGLLHLLKLHAWPDVASTKWRARIVAFLDGAQRRFTPCMRHRLDLGALYLRAVRQVRQMEYDGRRSVEPAGLGTLTLDDLLAEDADPVALLAKLSGHA